MSSFSATGQSPVTVVDLHHSGSSRDLLSGQERVPDNNVATLQAKPVAGAASLVVAAAGRAGASPIPQLVVAEKGAFANLYLRVRDYLVDRFPSLDSWLPEGGRNSGEKAMVYALKVRDIAREIATLDSADPRRRELARKADSFVVIAGNARGAAENLEAAKFYTQLAHDFAVAGSPYPTGPAFSRLLDLFRLRDEEETADRPVDFTDLPFLANAAKAIDEYDKDERTPCTDALRLVLTEEDQRISRELQALPQEVERVKAALQQTQADALDLNERLDHLAAASPGERAGEDIDGLRDEHRAFRDRGNDGFLKVVELSCDVDRLRYERKHVDTARSILNVVPSHYVRREPPAAAALPLGRVETKDDSPGAAWLSLTTTRVSPRGGLSTATRSALDLGTADASIHSDAVGSGYYGGGYGLGSNPFGNDGAQ